MATQKKLEQYLLSVETAHKTSLDAYSDSPAKAFLLYVCDAYDAFAHCLNKFTKKKNGEFNKDSLDSLRHISCALLGTIMGHFETYQKALFAGLVERTGLLAGFDSELFFRTLKKITDREVLVSTTRLMAFRELKAPVGLVLADSLGSWHDPARVNAYLKAVLPAAAGFDAASVADIALLWQLRHSIVHTGAWITLPDAQKVDALSAWGGKPIILEQTFLNAVARRLHAIVKALNGDLIRAAGIRLGTSPPPSAMASFSVFLKVESPKTTWIR